MRISLVGTALRQWGRINPKCLFEDYPSPAGSEMAMLTVAHELAKRGHNVKVFCDCETGTFDNVEYYRPELALPILTSVQQDAIVSWSDPGLFLYPVKSRLNVLMSQSSTLTLGQAADKVDRYFAISRTSAKMLLDSEPYADPAKMWATRNGVFLKRFGWEEQNGKWVSEEPGARKRDRHHLVWASSPDRGLHHLVDIFKLVRQEVPDARLTVAYDFDRAYSSYKANQPGSVFVRYLEKAKELKEVEGVEVVQHLTQPKLAELLLSAGILAYPCDPIRPTETYCVSVNEAMAAGMPVLISDADCLTENYGSAAWNLGRPINHEEWAKCIISTMTNTTGDYDRLSKASLKLAAVTDVSEVAEEWETFFEEYFAGKQTTADRSLAARIGK